MEQLKSELLRKTTKKKDVFKDLKDNFWVEADKETLHWPEPFKAVKKLKALNNLINYISILNKEGQSHFKLMHKDSLYINKKDLILSEGHSSDLFIFNSKIVTYIKVNGADMADAVKAKKGLNGPNNKVWESYYLLLSEEIGVPAKITSQAEASSKLLTTFLYICYFKIHNQMSYKIKKHQAKATFI